MHTAGKFAQAFSSTSDRAQILGRLLVTLSKLRMKFEPFLNDSCVPVASQLLSGNSKGKQLE